MLYSVKQCCMFRNWSHTALCQRTLVLTVCCIKIKRKEIVPSTARSLLALRAYTHARTHTHIRTHTHHSIVLFPLTLLNISFSSLLFYCWIQKGNHYRVSNLKPILYSSSFCLNQNHSVLFTHSVII